MKEILHLLYRLRRPQRFTDPPPPPLPESLDDESWALGRSFSARREALSAARGNFRGGRGGAR